MPVSTLFHVARRRVTLPSEFDERLVVNPTEGDFLRDRGLISPEAFLAIPGEIISGHPDRHVMRVDLGVGRIGYLKREHCIRTKERYRNWRAGFGWTSKSVREGMMLQRLGDPRELAPHWLAFGEDGQGRAFLLLEEVPGAIDLRRGWPTFRDHDSLAIALGRFCAELHQARIDHPDLSAKHVLFTEATREFTLIDWQRATSGQHLPWSRRVRALAGLLATLPGMGRNRAGHFLWAYLRVVAACQNDVPKFAAFARRVERQATALLRRRGVREQRQPPLDRDAQRLVWLDGEALCALPEVAEVLDPPAMRGLLYNRANHDQLIDLGDGRAARHEVGVHLSWLSRTWARLRTKAYRSPELRKARLLFHLERYQVPSPKLLAYGQRSNLLRVGAFLLTEEVDTIPLAIMLRDADEDLRHLLIERLAETLARLHEAGCAARQIESFAVENSRHRLTVRVADPARLVFRKRLTPRQRKTDASRVARSMNAYCGPIDARPFLDLVLEGR